MCDLCGLQNGTESISFNTGISWYACSKCYSLMRQNREIGDWVATIAHNLQEKVKRSLREFVMDYQFKEAVDRHFDLLKDEWIRQAKSEVETHVRSEVQKVLFVDGMGNK